MMIMKISMIMIMKIIMIIMVMPPSGAESTCSQLATPHHLQNSKWPPGGLTMAYRVWKGVYPYVFGAPISFC